MTLQIYGFLLHFSVALLHFKYVLSYLILSLLLLLLLEFFLCHAVLPFNPVQLLIQRALVNVRLLNENDTTDFQDFKYFQNTDASEQGLEKKKKKA